MKKSEKIIILCFIISFILVVISSVFTLYQLKPDNYTFEIEKIFNFKN